MGVIPVLAFAAMLAILSPGCECSRSRNVGVAPAGASWWVRSADPVPGVDSGQVSAVTLIQGVPEGVTVVVWSDLRSETSRSSGDPGLSYFDGTHAGDGRSLSFRCETRDGRNATVTIAGKTYDSARGPLFLVSTLGGTPRVAQLALDVARFPRDGERVRELAAATPAIRDFFRGAKQGAPPK